MEQGQLKEKILSILENNKTGTLATVRNNRPHSRYMTFFNDGLTLYTATNKETHKVGDLEENPYVHILLGYEGEGYGDSFLEIEGKAAISESVDLKQKLWNPHFEAYFKGPDDPEYIVLVIKPDFIRMLNGSNKDIEELDLSKE